MSSSSFPPALPQTTKHLLQGLPDWLTSDRAQHPMADLLGARAQAWQPCRPTAMKREAGRVLHLWRILLAAATTSTCTSAKTSSPAQGIFRTGNRQSIVTLGRSPRSSLLVQAHVCSAGQASAIAHVLQHPGPQVGEAAVFRQHDSGPWVTLRHVQCCDGQSSSHLLKQFHSVSGGESRRGRGAGAPIVMAGSRDAVD